jgi:hypothetical protein
MNYPNSEYHKPSESAHGGFSFREESLLGFSLTHLEDAEEADSNLIALLEQEPSSETAETILSLRKDRQQVSAEIERRYARIERLESDPLMVEVLQRPAAGVQISTSIQHYLACVRPGILIQRDGHIYRAVCPFLGHDYDEGNLRIFEGDYAWCDGCQRGGNLFRVVGLVEGLTTPFEQVQRAAEILGLEGPEVVRKGSPTLFPPSLSHRQPGGKERSRPAGFAPIRVINGRVVS